MQSLMRLVCIGYLIYLTALLLTADPTRLVVGHGLLPKFLRDLLPEAHLLSFWVLSVLTLAARWPIPRWLIFVLLVSYAGATEVAQSFLPPRAAELKDWLQDIGGIAAGALMCWVAALCGKATMRMFRKPAEAVPTAPANEWDAVQSTMSRKASGDKSWWS